MPGSKALQRQEYIMDILEKKGDVSAKILAKTLDVSIWTIRRDLNMLEERGILKRYYGGAGKASSPDEICQLTERGSFQVSAIENQADKRRMLRIYHFKGEIVTNALDIALELSEDPDIRVVCTGGDVQPRYRTLVGTVSERMLKLHYFDVAVIGVSGISLRYGLTVYSQVNATALELMVEHSCRTILVADKTKLDRVSFASLSLATPVNYLVTDQPLPREYNEYFLAMNTAVVVADLAD